MLPYTTCFQMRITFVMIPIVSTTWPKPVLYVMPLRKRNSGTGCFLDVDMLAHSIFPEGAWHQRMPSFFLDSFISCLRKAAFPGCAGLNNQSTSQTECTHRHRQTDTHTYLDTSTSFKTHIIAKPICPNPSGSSILVCQFFI